MKDVTYIDSKLQEFVHQVSQRVNPKPGDEQRYIGLEHLTSNRLLINSWGGDIELKGQKFAMEKGDILLGKRNAYLKRVNISPIDGIFSAHGMVLREKGNLFSSGFLPYFLLSTNFWNRAISISEGSLSPTIKWGTLATQSFRIPDIESQNKILPILNELTAQERQINELLQSVTKSLRTFQMDVFGNYFDVVEENRVKLPEGWKKKTVGEILNKTPESGCSLSVVDRETNHYVLNLNCLTKNGFMANGYKSVDPELFLNDLELNNGDLLISRSNTVDLVGLIGIYSDELERKAIFPDTMWRLIVKEELVIKEFLMNYLLSPYARREIQRIAAGSSGSMKKINKTGFSKIFIPVPSKERQEQVNGVIRSFYSTRSTLVDKLEKVCNLRLRIIDNLLMEK